ncbi:MAG: ABC transporter permease [Promethearchaeota archaeon]
MKRTKRNKEEMKFGQYIRNNFIQKRVRTFLCVFGLIIASTGIIGSALIADRFSESTSAFFSPFGEYDQVVSKGTNFLQLLPTESSLNSNLESDLEITFNKSVIPCLIVPNRDSIASFANRYLMGFQLKDIPIILDRIGLQSGEWPQNKNQIIVGDAWKLNTSITLYNRSFQVIGVLNPQFSYNDYTIIIDFSFLQNLSQRNSTATNFFISSSIDGDLKKISKFESDHPSVDILTQNEIKQIKGRINSNFEKIKNIMGILTSFSGIVFVFVIELSNLLNRKKDYDLLQILGASRFKVFRIIWMESFQLIIVGLLIGIPVATLSYSFVWTWGIRATGNLVPFWHYLGILMTDLFHHFPFITYLNAVILILGGGMAFAALGAGIALKKLNLNASKIKQ